MFIGFASTATDKFQLKTVGDSDLVNQRAQLIVEFPRVCRCFQGNAVRCLKMLRGPGPKPFHGHFHRREHNLLLLIDGCYRHMTLVYVQAYIAHCCHCIILFTRLLNGCDPWVGLSLISTSLSTSDISCKSFERAAHSPERARCFIGIVSD